MARNKNRGSQESTRWGCGHCGEEYCQDWDHPRKDRVPLDGISRPRPWDKFGEAKHPKRQCVCKHHVLLHEREQREVRSRCLATHCRCQRFKCGTCEKNPCSCRVEWHELSSERGKKRIREAPKRSHAMAAVAKKAATLSEFTRQLARVVRAEMDEEHDDD